MPAHCAGEIQFRSECQQSGPPEGDWILGNPLPGGLASSFVAIFIAGSLCSGAHAVLLRPAPANAAAPQPAASPWEMEVSGAFENRGVARIEKLATRYVLTTYCRGIHRAYIDGGEDLDLERYLAVFVRARYTYVDRVPSDVKCVRAPCGPVTERRIVLAHVDEVPVRGEELTGYIDTCSIASSRPGP